MGWRKVNRSSCHRIMINRIKEEAEVALLVMIVRKMVKNKWLEMSLLMGLILIVAMVSSMPIYTDAILHRMLIKDLEQQQTTSNIYPGVYTATAIFSDVPEGGSSTEQIARLDQAMNQAKDSGFQLPVQQFVIERYTPMMKLIPRDATKINPDDQRFANILGMSGMEENIRLVDGRLPAKEQPVDGVYEAVIVQNAQLRLKMVLGDEFEFEDELLKQTIRIKSVGVIDRKEYDSLYWTKNINSYQKSFIIPFDIFERDITNSLLAPIRASTWHFALDYSKMQISNIEDYMNTNQFIKSHLQAISSLNGVKAEALQTLSGHEDREKKLRLLLWSMNVPVLIMLAFYLFMVANLITDRQKTEIAVLRSRGASRFQIMTSFFIEGIILSLIAMLIGPFLGLLLTRVLGASNGFLEFVQRSAMEVNLNTDAYRYGLYSLGIGLIMIMVPAWLATRTTIVGHKQQLARKQKLSFLHKYYMDIILIAVSIYGLTSFKRRIKDLTAAGLDSTQFSIDPLLFLVPALFILGCGLLFLRIYPLFIQLIYWIGRKWWSPPLYSTLIQVGRSSSHYQFLMVFLVMTLATGLFSASAARTMNQNNHDKIYYQNGADIVLKTKWLNDAPRPAPPGAPQAPKSPFSPDRTQYIEPLHDHILNKLPGVEHYAKVFIKDNAFYTTAKSNFFETKLYGIDTDDFGMTAWFKDGLLEHHINDYLNLIATDSSSVLISRSIADREGLKPGDQISVGWDMVQPRRFVVYGIIDYFPTFQPNPTTPGASLPNMIVGHLSTIKTLLALEPYEYWFKLEPGASREEFVKAIEKEKLLVIDYRDTTQQINKLKNDPFQLAVNGVMTLGFIISIIISFCGFLLYWILTLQGRILQIGVFRAMGISFRQLIYMLVAEQLLTSGAAILIGSIDGNMTSRLFVPFFQLSFNPTTQVPPFQVIFDPSDTTGLFLIVTVMIGSGLGILTYLLSRIKIHQAVKLGED
jgi:putative ABC transport system permease protein